MCGITGFFVNGPRAGCDGVLRRMTASLRHRGPDDEGAYIDSHMALGVRRLSVIDLETGRQPISNEDHTVHVVLNGEIYNFAELRKRLEGRGHTFRTQSDAEVIVHAYEEAGDAVVTELDGMFAFALWDAPRRRLLLARDRMGEKPLYYHAGPATFVFGSELRALLECPDVPRALSLERDRLGDGGRPRRRRELAAAVSDVQRRLRGARLRRASVCRPRRGALRHGPRGDPLLSP